MILRKSLAVLGALCLSTVPVTAISPADIPSDTPVSQLIESANANLARGKAQDALVYFDVAIHKNPSDYLTLFKRGATYLSLGKNQQASKDFDQVLVLKPGFEGALTQRAKIRSRNADWPGAKQDYMTAKKKDTQDWLDLEEAEGAEQLSIYAEQEGKWEECVTHASTAILVAGTALELRQRRARCRFEQGQIMEAIADLNHVLQINPGNPEPYLRISAMSFYSLGETEKGTASISKCLHNDPDNKACSKLRKSEKAIERTLKKFNAFKHKRQFASAVKLLIPQGEDPGLLQETKDDFQAWKDAGYIHAIAPNGLYASLVESACEAYTEMNNFKKATPFCEEALTFNDRSLPALLNKAQRQIDADKFEPALGTLNQAQEEHGRTQKIQELMQKAQQLLKRSKQKDYYKVLGVSRDADERDIKKAFRRLTVQHHPDKAAKNGVTQEEAQKKMSAINEAYEVLSDPELKARFDRGEDPNDPHAGNGGNPFQGSPFGFGQGGQPIFFQQGGGGQRQFKFQAGGGGMPNFGGFNFG
ncbi:Putative DnaJ domain, tetratricopeptide-like helical domain superfamily [Septoria linicola]|uniref:Tetratricopeptide repeat and J domain-containing co-chaperone DNJ1 n=1 Tax=Septoria linicola TaxID=215465 RepID=A0A9Q9ES91_9PEZI|nr:Putative DnaJ domain, tetratricopeptide-like helical domain superfamily [Septoria linicola]